MGILDDAIREHLDLKRRLGAEEDELARLEGEAFGPATRPGEPDFPEQPPTGEAAAVEGEATAVAPEATVEEAIEAQPTAPHAIEPEPVEPPSEPQAELEPEPAPEPDLPPEAELPADEELPDAAVPLARELRAIVEPPADPATGESEIAADDDLELDLDLELDEPEPVASDPTPTPPREQPPVESFDTVEHHFEEAIEDTGDIEVVEGEVAEEPLTGEDDQLADEDDGEEEDVLEETPEFLREKPEDDELWFEQGSPKDFDF